MEKGRCAMKARGFVTSIALLVLLSALMIGLSQAQGSGGQESASLLAPMGAGFTYQGQILRDGEPVTAVCDVTFRLYDQATGGSQVGSTIVKAVPIANGLLTTDLDFGAAPFIGEARWIEIALQCPGDAGPTVFSERQALAPAPYALYAPRAGDADLLGGKPATAFWQLNGNGGTDPALNFLGTTDPVNLTLAVSGTAALRLEPNATSPNLIGGHQANSVNGGVAGATIGGGGSSGGTNVVTDDYGTIGGGVNNRVGNVFDPVTDAPYATVGGGYGNLAAAEAATVGGGEGNWSGSYATVGGGRTNSASGAGAAICGGQQNVATAVYATVPGGFTNVAQGDGATVGGGANNTASGVGATVAGGNWNDATGDWSAIGGGEGNDAISGHATIGGGSVNVSSGVAAVVGGGESNDAAGQRATIGGGFDNSAGSEGATVGGGTLNAASAAFTTIDGGQGNVANATYASVGGGEGNVASGTHTSVGGGWGNAASGTYATIAGGLNSTANGGQAFVGGGQHNAATGALATVAGGFTNRALTDGATVGGGGNNTARGVDATVAGGQWNDANGGWSAIGGGGSNDAGGGYATIGGGYFNYAPGPYTTVPGGLQAQADLHGQMAYASGMFSAYGDAQTSVYVLRHTTTDATPTELALDGAVQHLTITDTRTLTFDILVVARSDAAASAGYQIQGVIENNGGTTSFVGTPSVTALGEDVAAWDVSVVADDTHDRLLIQVTGAADTTVRWVATVRAVEVSW
jgi:hypothetical protein